MISEMFCQYKIGLIYTYFRIENRLSDSTQSSKTLFSKHSWSSTNFTFVSSYSCKYLGINIMLRPDCH